MSFASAFGWDNVFNAISQERQMDRDADAADTSWRRGQENMRLSNEFSERMANTAHQRAVTDLRAAGLNPILAATKGMGAPSPTGATAGVQSQAPAPDFSKSFGPAIANMTASTANLTADTKVKGKLTDLHHFQANTEVENQRLRQQQILTEQQNTRAAEANANSAEDVAKGRRLEGQIDEGKWGEFFRYLDRIRGTTGAIRDIK